MWAAWRVSGPGLWTAPGSCGSWPGQCFEICDVMMTLFVLKNKTLEIPFRKAWFSLPWVQAVEYFCMARCSPPGAGSVCAQGGDDGQQGCGRSQRPAAPGPGMASLFPFCSPSLTSALPSTVLQNKHVHEPVCLLQ